MFNIDFPTATDEQIDQYIRTNYPSFIDFLPITDIANLLRQAAREQWDPLKLTSAIEATDWWKQHSKSARDWFALTSTDPATAQSQKDMWIAQVHNLASQNGVNLLPAQLDDWASHFLSMGVQPGDPLVMNAIVNLYQSEPAFRTPQGGGTIAATADQVKALANQYMIGLPASSVTDWQGRIARGEATLQGLQSELVTQAKERYGYYASQIDSGSTPQSLFADRRQAIATQLEVSPDSIDLLHDPRWSQVLGVNDGKGGVQPMTVNGSIQLARSQPEWKGTTIAQSQGADLTMNVLKTLGAVA